MCVVEQDKYVYFFMELALVIILKVETLLYAYLLNFP